VAGLHAPELSWTGMGKTGAKRSIQPESLLPDLFVLPSVIAFVFVCFCCCRLLLLLHRGGCAQGDARPVVAPNGLQPRHASDSDSDSDSDIDSDSDSTPASTASTV